MFDDFDLSEIELEKDELLRVVYDDDGDDSDEQTYIKLIGVHKAVYKKNKSIKPCFPYRKEKIIIPNFQYRPGDPTAKNVYTEQNEKIFKEKIIENIKEQLRCEEEAIIDTCALPHITLKMYFSRNGIDRGLFLRKTSQSSTTYDNLLTKVNYTPQLETLVDVCWSLNIDYVVAKKIFEGFGYNLDGTTPKILAYKYVLKYFLCMPIKEVEAFLAECNVKPFKKDK